jgi:pimeloyl-ACP methyl ester carboxylesterase
LINLRTYGQAPYQVAVIHGGPGAAGEMAPVARELASARGVLEPLQTAGSVAGQVGELKKVLEENGDLPVILVGFSWGAWLAYLVATHHPSLVRKLVLIGSGPFEEKYVARLQETRLSRLSEIERVEFRAAFQALTDSTTKDKDAALARLGAVVAKTDSYDPMPHETNETDLVGVPGDIFHNVWKEAAELRRSGKLLEYGRQVRCPVVAIHGDYDPHPAEGVQEPLSAALKDFRFILLANCGHTPWIEKQAREAFYQTLNGELGKG